MDVITSRLLSAACAHATGDHAATTGWVREFVGESPRLVDNAAMAGSRYAIRHAFQRGWLPADLHELATRTLGPAGASYVVDMIADDVGQHATATVHRRWLEQVRQIDATSWWTPDRPHLSQWSAQHRCGRTESLLTVIEVIALLVSVPELPRVLPLPGTARNETSARSAGVDEKVLARVRALLAKAESTSFSEEAEALSAKAQELMTRHALDRALVDATPDQQSATARRIWLDNPYAGAKALLVDAVAVANRCRTMFYEKLGFVTVLGDEVDLEIVELLTTSLLVQATKAMVAKGSQTSHSGQSRTRSFRRAFLVAYATRIGERLRGASDAEVAPESESSKLLPVLAARRRAVDDLFDAMFPRTINKSVSVGNAAGWFAGRAAADLAVLETRRAVSG